ncbi:cAMP-dependent protein kinase catalytic subunit [Entomophthora muscae]|uniref:cAMP-dependent protein kinase catalytic subunit n=1 Tax=Entomophthora muscae TaxID=34485 RepID=A0ACC2S2K0_9FUNG|nr:cAMP-dependent protein kinase catalytic subunit [Entomophthora muscae]
MASAVQSTENSNKHYPADPQHSSIASPSTLNLDAMNNEADYLLSQNPKGDKVLGLADSGVGSSTSGLNLDHISELHSNSELVETNPVPIKEEPLQLNEFDIMRTLGTGSFGRVHLVRKKSGGCFYAMKVLKKSEIVRLKQVEHVHNEKHVLKKMQSPFSC